MNNKFFVPVLALGIAALGAAASPAQAATGSLVATTNIGNSGPITYRWTNTVTMTGASTLWTDAMLYQAQDGSTYGTSVYDGMPNDLGPGTCSYTEPVTTPQPASGHSISTWILDKGNDLAGPGVWHVTTNVINISTT